MRKEHVSACFRNMKLLDDGKRAALLHSEVDKNSLFSLTRKEA